MRKFLTIGDDSEPAVVRWRQPLGRTECPYSYRWMVDLGRLGSVRLHRWISSDDARAKHDHSQDFVTLVLWGSYIDEACVGDDDRHCEVMRAGMVRRRKAEHRHTVYTDGCWTLLYFWPVRRQWGFWVPRKSSGFRFYKPNKYFAKHGHHPCDR